MQFAYIFQCSVIKNTFSYLLNFINLHLGPKELLYSRSPVNKGKSTRTNKMYRCFWNKTFA